MLKFFRESTNSFFAKALITLLALSFFGWGISDYLTGQLDTTAVTINGIDIPVQDFDRELRTSGGNGQVAIQTLALRTILEQHAKELGLRISDAQMLKTIMRDPSFIGEDGTFNETVYKQAIQNAGMTVKGFEKRMRSNLTRNQLGEAFTGTITDKQTATRFYNHQNESVDAKVLVITNKDVGKLNEATDEELKAYYESHTSNFKTPEYRTVTAITLDKAKIADTITVTDEEALEFYNEDPKAYAQPERRQASHILVKTQEQADDLYTRIQKGESFEALAKEYSTDTASAKNGGNLGSFSYEDMVPQFSDAAWELNVGEVSEPVSSPFGYHIIKLTKILEATNPSFENVKLTVIDDAKKFHAEDAFFNLQQNVEDRIAAGESLRDIGEDFGLPVYSYKKLAADGSVASEDETQQPYVRDIARVAYNTENGLVSEATELTLGVVGYIEVLGVETPREMTYDESKSLVKALVENQASKDAIANKAKDIIQKVQQGQSINTLARGMTNDVETFENINRQRQNSPSWMQNALINTLIKTQEGQPIPTAVPVLGGMAVVVSGQHHDASNDPEEIAKFMENMGVARNNEIQQQLIGHLMQDADIDVNGLVLQRTYGQTATLN